MNRPEEPSFEQDTLPGNAENRHGSVFFWKKGKIRGERAE